MAKHNFGTIKATFTNYLNESENLHAKEMFNKFMGLIKESALLRLQFEIYKNLESKHIPSENMAIKYIDDNIRQLGRFDRAEFATLNEQVSSLMEGLNPRVSDKKSELYSHIDTLIYESLERKPTSVDDLHESFTFVLEYVKNNVPKLVESTQSSPEFNNVPKEYLVKKAIQKFNNRFESLNENDKRIFKSIISDNISEKQEIFNLVKEETKTILNSLIGNADFPEKIIKESLNKINDMSYNNETYSKDILSLVELKNEITL